MRATVNYMDPDTVNPEIYLFEPPPGVPGQYPTVGHSLHVNDGRNAAEEFALNQQGFVMRKSPESVIGDFYDEELIRDRYYAEISDLIERETGAKDVAVFDHTYRSSRELAPGESEANQPVYNAHNDYTNATGPVRAREGAGEKFAEAIDEQRFWIVNVWRPINGRVEQKPLALCDLRSMEPEDFVAAKIRFPTGRNGGVMAITHRDEHRWSYFSNMSVDEVLLFRTFDPRATGAQRFGAHCAVDEPGMTGNERIRESIEVRAVAIFD